jgi:putative tryptophan/tyrosine transport system substrate-binding protein
VAPVPLPNVARPAGNITGVTDTATGLAGKRLELLRDLLPNLRRIAVLRDGTNPSAPTQVNEAETAARALGLQLVPVTVRGPDDFDAAFKSMRGVDGLLQLESALFTTHRARLAELALKARLATVSGNREMVAAGGLLAYAPHFPDVYRSAASYVDKILNGAKPADMLILQPTKFELVINFKTANAFGIEIPQSILLRTDAAIE